MTQSSDLTRPVSESWSGIFPSLPTPFDSNDGLDLAAQRRVVRFAVEAGSHGLICFGLAGEVFRLTPSERLTLLEVIVDETGGRVPVFAGIGTETDHASLALAREVARIGATGVVVPPPITARLSRRELLHYFEAVAEASALPVMIQDAPEYLKVELGPELIQELLVRCENIRLVKLEGGPDLLGAWVDHLADSVSVFGGNGGMYLLDCLDEGAAGIAPGADLVDMLVEIFQLHATGVEDEPEARFQKLLPALVFQLQDIDHYNACAKYVLARRGILDADHLRSPGFRLSSRGQRLLDHYLERLGLVEGEPAH